MTEQELINLLTKGIPREACGLRVGIGDDCAVIAGDGFDWLVTTDALFEGVHFDLTYTTDILLGRKSLTVNLSDIAAMGGQPLYYTVSIGVPPDFSAGRLEDLYRGMQEAADKAQVLLIGGDTCASKSGLVFSITAIGRVEKGKAILRRRAKAGDGVYVTGTLGDAALGLWCFKRGVRDGRVTAFLRRYNDPTARIEAGSWLAKTDMITAMIDVSDGLLADLGHIADASNVGFEIQAENVPMNNELINLATMLVLDPMELAMTGGEDYELVFTVAKNQIQSFEQMLRENIHKFGHLVTRIGTITENPKKRLALNSKGQVISFRRLGYDHFINSV